MSPFSPVPAVIILLLALLTVSLLNHWFKMAPTPGRYVAIDGLRGYLAFLVFIHHAATWYSFLHIHRWRAPLSNLYNNFGPTSVFYFFMITAFLFFTRLIESRNGRLNWGKLYRSRLLRILPLYLFAVTVLFIVVATVTGFTLQQPLTTVLLQAVKWIGFMAPDINGLNTTWLLTAGVTWSLSFEWLFYFTLPLWGFFFRIRTKLLPLLLTLAGAIAFTFIIYYFYHKRAWQHLSPFLGGMAAAFLVKNKQIQYLSKHPATNILIVVLLLVVVLYYEHTFYLIPWLCNWLVFVAIAGGNPLFGILSSKASFLLGQISYSLYLLHGLLLYILFQFHPAVVRFALQSSIHYWLVIAAAGILLTVICTLTYQYIELPGMHLWKRKQHTQPATGSGQRPAEVPAPR